MTKFRDGGAAFPGFHPSFDGGNYVPGMSLRTWFAGQALAGLISHAPVDDAKSRAVIVRRAFDLADRMIDAHYASLPADWMR